MVMSTYVDRHRVRELSKSLRQSRPLLKVCLHRYCLGFLALRVVLLARAIEFIYISHLCEMTIQRSEIMTFSKR
jgi:hypothetical protein